MTDLLSMKQVDSVNFPRMSEREAEARVFADKRAVAVIDEQRQVINDLIVQNAELRKLSVTNVLLRVVPDEFGNGFEVYAKSVADVQSELTDLSVKADEVTTLRSQVKLLERLALTQFEALDFIPRSGSQLGHAAETKRLSAINATLKVLTGDMQRKNSVTVDTDKEAEATRVAKSLGIIDPNR